ncbi:MAG: hypothetical protein PQ612_09770 [Rickettsiales bacterium]|nr:hypothetical protein [Pseudomonadota bacterium]MDA0966080.1 hypothetical protein [Pseudomonadota bacterium]MDG4544263.1 hypothetical protein [Rickettsiales bacterium]MDG4546442.1 hypothetical protein [Rickettsiales bacterium]MDG4548588.1 hypothetical protein [Rickettsiales bacterium]
MPPRFPLGAITEFAKILSNLAGTQKYDKNKSSTSLSTPERFLGIKPDRPTFSTSSMSKLFKATQRQMKEQNSYYQDLVKPQESSQVSSLDEETFSMKPLTSNKDEPEKGSNVAVIAPSHWGVVTSKFDTPKEKDDKKAGQNKEYKKTINGEGFNLYRTDDSMHPPIDGNGRSNTVEERARAIINALNDPKTNGMIVANGGGGAFDVANVLNEYDNDPKATEKKITEAWKKEKRNEGKELPNDFFYPRGDDENTKISGKETLDQAKYSDSTGKKHGLPKRDDVALVGFSDGSVITNFIEQRGIARTYYGNPAETTADKGISDVTETLTNPDSETTYKGLKQPNVQKEGVKNELDNISKQELPIHATELSRMALTAGTQIPFHLDKPSILAIESIDSPDDMAKMLKQSQEAGLLDNVKAIVFGRVNYKKKESDQNFEPVDMSKSDGLTDFIKNSDIPILLTDNKDTFGHGPGVDKTIANQAPTKISKQDDGTFDLSFKRQSSDQTRATYYASERHSREKLNDKKPEKKELNDGKHDAIFIDQKTMRHTAGTKDAIDASGKVAVITSDETRLNNIDLAVTQLMESGKKPDAIMVAIPKDKLTPESALKRLTTGSYATFEEIDENDKGESSYVDRGIPIDENGKWAKTFQEDLTKAGVSEEQMEISTIRKKDAGSVEKVKIEDDEKKELKDRNVFTVDEKGEKFGDSIGTVENLKLNMELKVKLNEDDKKNIMDTAISVSLSEPLKELLAQKSERYGIDIKVKEDDQLSQFKGVDKGASVNKNKDELSFATSKDKSSQRNESTPNPKKEARKDALEQAKDIGMSLTKSGIEESKSGSVKQAYHSQESQKKSPVGRS